MSAGGASAAGATAANAGNVASQSLINAGNSAAQGAYQNAQLYEPWMAPGQNALATLSDPKASLDATINSPGYQLTKPYLDRYGETVQGYQQGLKNTFDAWGLDKFETSPGYQFRLDQGRNALANSGSARGMTLSGAQAQALTSYNQGAASDEYGKWMANYQDWMDRYGGFIDKYGQYTGMAGNAMSGAANSSNQNLQYLTGLGFDAAKGQINTNMAGNNYSFQGYQAGMPAYQQGQNALAGSQSASANAMASGITGAAKSAASIAGFGMDRGWFGGGNSAGGAGTDRGAWT